MTRHCAQALLALAALAAEPAASGALDPGTTLCLYPVGLPLEEQAGEERRAAIQAQLAAALRAAGFEVADPARVRQLRERSFDEAGPLFDPATGERRPEIYERALSQLERALRDDLGCDVQLGASVVIVRAPFAGGTAAWDGTRQQVASAGRMILGALGGVVESGWVNAFSLRLRVADFRDETLALRSAGIETPLQLAVLKDQDLVPQDLWLKDSARIEAAIQSALGPGGSALRAALRPPAAGKGAPGS
jgi:hypothetical protein